MIKRCIICDDYYDAKGAAKTCGADCGKELDRRYHNTYNCTAKGRESHRIKQARWRANNPEKVAAAQRRYRAKHGQVVIPREENQFTRRGKVNFVSKMRNAINQLKSISERTTI